MRGEVGSAWVVAEDLHQLLDGEASVQVSSGREGELQRQVSRVCPKLQAARSGLWAITRLV